MLPRLLGDDASTDSYYTRTVTDNVYHLVVPNAGTKFTEPGRVVGWKLKTTNAGDTYKLAVLRPVGDGWV